MVRTRICYRFCARKPPSCLLPSGRNPALPSSGRSGFDSSVIAILRPSAVMPDALHFRAADRPQHCPGRRQEQRPFSRKRIREFMRHTTVHRNAHSVATRFGDFLHHGWVYPRVAGHRYRDGVTQGHKSLRDSSQKEMAAALSCGERFEKKGRHRFTLACITSAYKTK